VLDVARLLDYDQLAFSIPAAVTKTAEGTWVMKVVSGVKNGVVIMVMVDRGEGGGVWAEKLKLSATSVSGVPCEVAIEGDEERLVGPMR
jgi:hypothetical protein